MNQDEFGYRIRQALNEGLERLDYRTSYRLQQARQAALARQASAQPEAAWSPVVQTAGGLAANFGMSGWMGRLGLAAPLLAIAVGYFTIYQYQESRRISELADMDFAVLLDEVPLSTYADKGFGALLSQDSDDH
jgi:Protein of unknown function (DUF3619)